MENYRPVSMLNCFLKIYEKYILEQFKPFLNDFLYQNMEECSAHHISSHVLISLVEHWKKALDKRYGAGAVLMAFFMIC